MSDNALAELNGFLHAFELLNLGADHESTFRLERLFEVGGDAHLSLSKHLQPSNYEFSFLEDKNWRTSLSSELKRWLFDLLPVSSPYTHENVYARFFELLQKALGSTEISVCRVMIKAAVEGDRLKPFYECDWSDFLLRSSNGLFFLHFGVSD